MLRPHSSLCALMLAMCLCSVSATSVRAQNEIAPDQMRNAAAQELRGGQPARALRYARALTTRDATDFTAWLVRSKAHRAMGEFHEAQAASRTAWSLAQTDDERYAAAMVMAQALSSHGKRTRAQLWLRRAGQHAPSDTLEAIAKDHFRYVQSRNPWRTDLNFILSPTSNVNNGSAKDRSQLNYQVSELLFGEQVEYALEGSSQALSGFEYGAGLTTRYRFRETFQSANDAFVRASFRSYSLSNEAKVAAPDVRGSDFAYGTFEVGFQHRRRVLDGAGEDKFEVSAGQSWFGGSRYASFAAVGASRSFALSPKALLHLSGKVKEEIGQNTSDRRTLNLQAGVTHRLSKGRSLHLSTGLAFATSDAAQNSYDEVRLRAAFSPKAEIAGASMQYGMTARLRDYDVSPHDPDGRSDLSLFTDVTATFHEIEYYGFNPSVTVRGAFTDSNINLFDVNQISVGLGIRSEF